MQSNFKVFVVSLVLLGVACNRPPAGSEGEIGGADDLEWWSGTWSIYAENNGADRVLSYTLASDGSFTYRVQVCDDEYSKPGSWELTDTGGSLDLLNAAGSDPFATGMDVEVGDDSTSFFREGSGDSCEVRYGLTGGDGVPWEKGAICLDDNCDRVWCDGSEPPQLLCP